MQMRQRAKLQLQGYGGRNCPQLTEHRYCNTHVCPLDCVVSQWGDYQACDKTCGEGAKTRYRHVDIEPKGNGTACEHLSETMSCNERVCPTDCDMSDWGGWSTCTRGCGAGWQERVRAPRVEPLNGGLSCPHYNETRTCNSQPCSTVCQFSESNSSCTRSCGGGTLIRTRIVHQHGMYLSAAEKAADPCNDLSAELTCNDQECPVDCEYGIWSQWSTCPVDCGGLRQHDNGTQMGLQSKSRSVTQAAYGGQACVEGDGHTTLTRICNAHVCDEDCVLSDWGGWGDCSATCGSGEKQRHRTIESEAVHYGRQCSDFALTDQTSCTLGACPIDCVMGPWSTEWDACTVTCGAGTRTRRRFRLVEQQYGGHDCGNATALATVGSDTYEAESKACDAGPCPVNCTVGTWQAWGSCLNAQGAEWCVDKATPNAQGTRSRKRVILTRANANGHCDVTLTDSESCQPRYPSSSSLCIPASGKDAQDCTKYCKTDCILGIYEPWSECSRSCGNGTQHRTRNVLQAAAGGGACNQTTQTRACNTHNCSLHLFHRTTKNDNRHMATPAPTPFDIGHAYAAELVHQGNQTNGQNAVLSRDARQAWGAANISAANAQTHEHEQLQSCMNGNDTVQSGWHGAGAGANYCNLCACNDGVLKCQKRDCGGFDAGEQCQFITCTVANKAAHGDTHLTNLDADETYIKVHHSHSEYGLEGKGTEHKCINNPYTGQCTCYCFAAGTTRFSGFAERKVRSNYTMSENMK